MLREYGPAELVRLAAGGTVAAALLFGLCYGFFALELALNDDCQHDAAPICSLHEPR